MSKFAGVATRNEPLALAAEAQRSAIPGSDTSLLTAVLSSVAAIFRAIVTQAMVLVAVAIFGLQAYIGMREITSSQAAAGDAVASPPPPPVESAAKEQELDGRQRTAMLAISIGSGVGLLAHASSSMVTAEKNTRRRG